MKAVLTLSAAVMLASLASMPAHADDGPLGPARQGKGQCFRPDEAAKTCASIAWFSWDEKGYLINHFQTALAATDAELVMTIDKAAAIKDGAVCSPIRVEDVVEATFTLNGQPADGAVTDHLRQALASRWGAVDHTLVCTNYVADGDAFQTSVTMNGELKPDLAQRVIWIGKDDGWKVVR